MGLIFKPNGNLDIATAATDLPAQSQGPGSVTSEALTRCKNLRIDRKGMLSLRDGSSKINDTALLGSGQLITNGIFEGSITGWTDSSDFGSSISFSEGTMLLQANTNVTSVFPSAPEGAHAQQSVNISSPSGEHTLTFDILELSGVGASFRVDVGTTSGGTDLALETFSEAGSGSVTFTPNTSTVYIKFTLATLVGAGFPCTAKLDNVSLSLTLASTVNQIIEQSGVRYAFAGNVIFRNELSIETGLTESQWSGIKYNQFNDTAQQVFALNGTDRKRIDGSTVYEWGITAPTAVTTAVGASTGLTGVYNAKITYCRKVGSVVVSESNPSPAGTNRTLANQSLSVTWTASSDSQVTHVRVYRTLAGGSTYFHDQDVAIGTLTLDTNTSDASLGDEVETDHDRPPLGQFVSGPAFDGTCFIVKENLLHFCKPKQPEYWPGDFFIEVSTLQDPGKCPVIFHNSQPYFLTKNQIYLIQGTGQGNLLPLKQDAKTGAQGIFGAVAVKGKGIFHTGSDGIYLFAGTDLKVSEATLDPIFRGEDTNGMPGVSEMETAWLHVFGNNLYFGYTSEGFDFPTNIIKVNLDTNRTSYYNYNDGTEVEIRCVTTDETNARLLAGDTLGFVRVLEDQSQTSDSGNAIDWETQSMDYTLQTRHHFPRFAKYDVEATDADSCIGEILVDDEVVQTHTLSGSRQVRHRHIETCNGKRCAIRISGSGPATVYAAELE